MLTVKQAAVRTGVSESLIYGWCADGSLPHMRLGRKGKRGTIRIEVEDLVSLLAALKVVTPSASAQTSSDRPVSPFSELNPKRLARAWKTG